MIALSILAISAFSLWNDRQNAWLDAERTLRNLLTALAQDIGGNIEALDFALKEISVDVADEALLHLPPLARHRILFDRARTVDYMGGVVVLNEAGNIIADSESILPRRFNGDHLDHFQAHRDRADVGLYVSRPFQSTLRQGDFSIAISRRLSRPDGSFAGVVASRISLSKFNALFQNLDLGQEGALAFLRDDGILLTRKPLNESQINQDLSGTPNGRHFFKERSGSFASTGALDGIQRFYVFGRVDGFPLVLVLSKSVDELMAAWRAKAVVQSSITLLICGALIGLTVLFQRELRRRTRAEAKLKRIARTDDLTSLPNRRAFREAYERVWRRATRVGAPLSVLFVDADYFKNFNDQYGHARGDEALCAIARVLDANIRRPFDLAARHGGEEFIVLLPDTDLKGARMIAENIRHAVLSLGISHVGSPYQVVTVSIGIASIRPSQGGDRDALLEAADKALYEAKASGRSCICEYEMPIVCHGQGLPSVVA
ncbi:sensor domain-containing diguanylate cyclase [Microvirga pakistanensis]|uniref:sensor domain-containing diguanylate cyclase n=1 Tax=Microvirga pakistanensis TaxID=1682650 RepID=UPI00141B32C8|nr:sensor domain-containing diguanylate cyclase [Microvirga pakistanensis]